MTDKNKRDKWHNPHYMMFVIFLINAIINGALAIYCIIHLIMIL